MYGNGNGDGITWYGFPKTRVKRKEKKRWKQKAKGRKADSTTRYAARHICLLERTAPGRYPEANAKRGKQELM